MRRPVLQCRIVKSERHESLVSIRWINAGKGGTFQEALTAAGFEDGDLVTIALRKGKITRPKPRLAQ